MHGIGSSIIFELETTRKFPMLTVVNVKIMLTAVFVYMCVSQNSRIEACTYKIEKILEHRFISKECCFVIGCVIIIMFVLVRSAF